MDLINYSAAGGSSRAVHKYLVVMLLCCAAMTGGLFRARAGLKPAIGGSVLGLLLRYKYIVTSLVSRLHPAFQCWMPKSWSLVREIAYTTS